jgi:hypothetical protein
MAEGCADPMNIMTINSTVYVAEPHASPVEMLQPVTPILESAGESECNPVLVGLWLMIEVRCPERIRETFCNVLVVQSRIDGMWRAWVQMDGPQ